MQKELGKDVESGKKRIAFLMDNCDTVEEKAYTKRFTPEQLARKKEELSEVAIKIRDIEVEKKEAATLFKSRLDPLDDERKRLVGDLKSKAALVTDLKNFEANVATKIERQKSEKGDFKDNYSGVVMSNLPEVFTVQLPIFKGMPAETIEVEFYASVNGREVTLQLISPGACQLLEDLRNRVIDEQIERIRGLSPEIAIIEQ